MIRHLVDKETAIMDMANDYKIQGTSLVESYEKGLQDHIDSYKANNERRHQNLVKVFEKAQTDRATTSKSVIRRHVQGMNAQWETHQKALMGRMAAALAACRE